MCCITCYFCLSDQHVNVFFHSHYSAWHIAGNSMTIQVIYVLMNGWNTWMDAFQFIHSHKYFKEKMSNQFLLLKSNLLMVKIPLVATAKAHFNHSWNECSWTKDHGGRRDQGECTEEWEMRTRPLSKYQVYAPICWSLTTSQACSIWPPCLLYSSQQHAEVVVTLIKIITFLELWRCYMVK